MSKQYLILSLIMACLFTSCPPAEKPIIEVEEEPIFSFAFVGCNRINRHDQIPSVPSTANLPVLERIFKDLDTISPQPTILFFLGDMIEGENNLDSLDNQLGAWVNRYENSLKINGIELVAVPGNHEMLHYGDPEYPLEGAIDKWMEYMTPYIPADRKTISNSNRDSLINRATFSFVRHNTAFVVMNTDTYNEGAGGANGTEGMIPLNWIEQQVSAYRQDPKVEHIFIMGHKPAYFDGRFHKGHSGFPDSETLWPHLETNKVTAMLSAHQHCYYRGQPSGEKTYQIVAGNGGSSRYGGTEPPKYFGYSVIHVYKKQAPKLESIGFQPDAIYNNTPPDLPSIPRDITSLVWSANPNNGYGKSCE